MVKEVQSQQEFMKIISQPKLVVVDFHAVWCGPCKMIAPQFEQLAKKYPNVDFIKVDVDKSPDLAQACGVSAMPTFCFFKERKPVENNVQGGDLAKIEAYIKKHGNTSGFGGQGRTLGAAPAASGSAAASGSGGLAGQAYRNPNAPQERPKPASGDEAIPDEYLTVDDSTLKRILAQKKLEESKKQQEAAAKALQNNKQPAPAAAEGSAPVAAASSSGDAQQQPAAAVAEGSGDAAAQVSQEEVIKAVKAVVNQEFYNSLIEMGFSEIRTLKALMNAGDSLDNAINWLDQHQNDGDIDAPIQFTVETDEQKKKRIDAEKDRLKHLLEEKRRAKAEADRKEELEREKKRRMMGKETQESMDKFKEEQRRREYEQAKKAKEKEKMEKERVKRKLEEEKLRRKLEKAKSTNNQAEIQEIERQLAIVMGIEPSKVVSAAPAQPAASAQQPQPAQATPAPAADECVLQIRLLDGTTIKANFKPNDTLQVVRNHCAMLQNNSRVNLMTNFPKKIFTAAEMQKTLKDLGLVKGSLICTLG